MDNLFLNRVNSWQGLVKKEQKSIFGKSIGSLFNLPFLLKMRFWRAPVLSNAPQATQTAPALKKDYPFRSPRRRLYPPACKPYGLEAKLEAGIQGFKRKTPRGLNLLIE
jgi:hypothetical protein